MTHSLDRGAEQFAQGCLLVPDQAKNTSGGEMRIGSGFAAIGLAALAVPGLASAQTAPADSVNEIIVTSNKQTETLQRAPSTVVVLSADQLVQRNIISLADLEATLTGAQIYNNANSGTVALRGVSQSLSEDSATPAIGFNLNGVTLPRESNISAFYDLERVEVLPGPQGTLYGGSSAGGVINVITRRPSSTYGAEITAEIGNYDLMHVTLAADLPLSRTFSIRPALDINKHDGFISNGTNDLDAFAARLSALWKPTDAFSLSVIGSVYKNKGLGDTGVARPGTVTGLAPEVVRSINGDASDPYKSNRSTVGYFNDKTTSDLAVETSYDFGPVTLTNIAGGSKFDIRTLNDGGVAQRDFAFKGYSLSDEFRISSNGGGKHNWLIGLYASKNISDATQVNIFPPAVLRGARSPSTLHANRRGYAIFGQDTYAFTDTTRFKIGGRYSWDKVSGSGTTVLPPTPLTPANSFAAGISNSTWDWKIGLEHDFRPDWMVYATVQTGYLPGGFNTLVASTPASVRRVFDPESLMSYTVGSKSRFFDRRVTFNTEFFYYDYSDYQQREIDVSSGTTVSTTYNAPKARIYGNQTDLTVQATQNDRFDLSFTALSAKFTKFSVPAVGNFSGYEMPYAASLSVILGYSHTFDLGSLGSLTAAVRERYNSGYWATYKHSRGTLQDAYYTTNLSLTYADPTGSWNAVAYMNNLEDNAVYTGMQAVQVQGVGWVSAALGRPRIYGLKATKRF